MYENLNYDSKTSDVPIRAVVQKVIPQGRHGPYAIATIRENVPYLPQVKGSITFSLKESSKVWEEDNWPEEGHEVILQGLTKKTAGWRAEHARFVRVSDVRTSESQQPATSNQQKNGTT